jgi:dGTPase
MTCENVGWKPGKLMELERHQLIRRMIGIMIADVIECTHHRIEQAGVQSPDDVQHLEYNLVGHSPEFGETIRQLKRFLYEKLYRHFRVVRMSVKAERFLADLFEEFTREPEQLHPEVRARFDEVGMYRAITDYIAGMTDRYALQEWERLFGPFERP